jgi:hypothetical protein
MTSVFCFRPTATRFLLVLAASLIILSRQAGAVILAENTAIGTTSGVGSYGIGSGSSAHFGAENFALTGLFNITSISHVALTGGIHPTSMSWGIYADAGGEPTNGSSLYSGTVTSGGFTTSTEGSVLGFALVRYSIALTGVTLPAGNYWVGFHSEPFNNGPFWAYGTGGTSMDGLSALSIDNGATWFTPYSTGGGGNFAFRVEGDAVPGAASLALLCASAVTGRRRRRLA